MQSDWKEIYRLTAEKTGKSEQTYKEIGNAVFLELYKKLRRPQSLILRLKGIGYWYMRKQRMEMLLAAFPPNWIKTEEDFKHPMQYLKNENKKEIFTLFEERVKEYQEYIKERDKVREKRHETQILLNPKKDED